MDSTNRYPLNCTTELCRHWDVKYAITELLANALDSDPSAEIQRIDQRKIEIRNKGLMKMKAFVFSPEKTSAASDSQIGYFGSGLKDAICVCLRENVTFVAVSGNQKFTAVKQDCPMTGLRNHVYVKVEPLLSTAPGTTVTVEGDALRNVDVAALLRRYKSSDDVAARVPDGELIWTDGRRREPLEIRLHGLYASTVKLGGGFLMPFWINITSMDAKKKQKLGRDRQLFNIDMVITTVRALFNRCPQAQTVCSGYDKGHLLLGTPQQVSHQAPQQNSHQVFLQHPYAQPTASNASILLEMQIAEHKKQQELDMQSLRQYKERTVSLERSLQQTQAELEQYKRGAEQELADLRARLSQAMYKPPPVNRSSSNHMRQHSNQVNVYSNPTVSLGHFHPAAALNSEDRLAKYSSENTELKRRLAKVLDAAKNQIGRMPNDDDGIENYWSSQTPSEAAILNSKKYTASIRESLLALDGCANVLEHGSMVKGTALRDRDADIMILMKPTPSEDIMKALGTTSEPWKPDALNDEGRVFLVSRFGITGDVLVVHNPKVFEDERNRTALRKTQLEENGAMGLKIARFLKVWRNLFGCSEAACVASFLLEEVAIKVKTARTLREGLVNAFNFLVGASEATVGVTSFRRHPQYVWHSVAVLAKESSSRMQMKT